MAIKQKNNFEDDSDITITTNGVATVLVTGGTLQSTVTTGGTNYNGGVSDTAVACANGDRYYMSFKTTDSNEANGAYALYGRSGGGFNFGGTQAGIGFSGTNLAARIWGGNDATTGPFSANTYYYGIARNTTGHIIVYWKTGGHSANIADYTLFFDHSGIDDIGQDLVFNGVAVGDTSAVYNWGPFAFTDSNGLTPQTPTIGSATATGQETIELTWTDVATSASADKIAIDRSLTSGSGFTEIDTVSIGIESYEDSGLDPDTTYYYKIRAVTMFDGVDYYSSYSSEADATTDPVPDTGGGSGEKLLVLGDI